MVIKVESLVMSSCASPSDAMKIILVDNLKLFSELEEK